MIISAGSCGLCICLSLSIKLHWTKNTRHKVATILKLRIHKWTWFIALCHCVSSYGSTKLKGSKQPNNLLRKCLCSIPSFWEAYSDRYQMCLCRPSGKAIKGLQSCWQVISASPATLFHLYFLISFFLPFIRKTQARAVMHYLKVFLLALPIHLSFWKWSVYCLTLGFSVAWPTDTDSALESTTNNAQLKEDHWRTFPIHRSPFFRKWKWKLLSTINICCL